MIPATWDASDYSADDPSAPGRPLPHLVSLHYLRSALRRRWPVCVLSAVLGLLAGTGFLSMAPAPHRSQAMLALAHDPQLDPSRAMATDVSLLTTRVVADRTIDRLGLPMTSEDFLKSVVPVQVSSDLLQLTLTAPTDPESVRRLDGFIAVYLEFRADQLSVQSDFLVAGMKKRIDALQGQIAVLTTRVNDLTESGDASTSRLSDVISERAQITAQVQSLQQQIQDATLRTASIQSSSRVIDPAAPLHRSTKRRAVLALASALVGGTSLGCGAVIFMAVISDRLRRRYEVAAALEVSVPVSVGRIRPAPPVFGRLPVLRRLHARRGTSLQLVAHGIESALAAPGRWGRLAVACIDNAAEVRYAVVTVAMDVQRRGSRVVLIDLTEGGLLQAGVDRMLPAGSADRPLMLRPRGVPALARTLEDLEPIGIAEAVLGEIPSLDLIDVCLVLADLDPAVGADHLCAWTDRVVVAVTSGYSSVERVRTAGELVRSAGLELRAGLLLRASAADDSSGVVTAAAAPEPVTRQAKEPATESDRPTGTEAGGGTS